MEGTEEGDGADAADVVDLAAYDLDGLRQELADLTDAQRIAAEGVRWTVVGLLVVGLVVGTVFGGMPLWVRIPFLFGTMLLSSVSVVLVAAFIVTRRHLETAADAAGKVLDTLGLIIEDLGRVAAGHAQLPIPELTDQILDQAVLPGIRDGMDNMLPLPMRFVGGPAAWLPSKVVAGTVRQVVERLPVTRVGRLEADQAARAEEDLGRIRAAYESLPGELERAKAGLEKVAGHTLTVASVPLVTLIVVSAIPLMVWLLIAGWSAG